MMFRSKDDTDEGVHRSVHRFMHQVDWSLHTFDVCLLSIHGTVCGIKAWYAFATLRTDEASGLACMVQLCYLSVYMSLYLH